MDHRLLETCVRWILACLIHASFSTLYMGLPSMILLFWFSICCFLTAVFATAFLSLPTLAGAESLMSGVLITANDCCEGCLWVKGKMVLVRCLTRFEKGSKYSGKLTRWIRNVFERASRKYETLGTGFDFSGEDFQNIGTFMVVKSSVFAVSSGKLTISRATRRTHDGNRHEGVNLENVCT